MSADNLGNGAVATFGTSALTLTVTKIEQGAFTRERVEMSSLATVGPKEYTSASLYDHAPTKLTFIWDSEEDFPIGLDAGTAYHVFPDDETITVTWPLGNGESVAGKIVGTGFITEVKPPDFENDVLQIGELTFTWNGLTGPKYTPATPTA